MVMNLFSFLYYKLEYLLGIIRETKSHELDRTSRKIKFSLRVLILFHLRVESELQTTRFN
jgi:hypothetical protein